MSADFEIIDSREGEWVCLTVSGELTMATAGSLDDRLRSFRAAGTPVRLDLSRLGFMDSNGLTVLVRALNHAREGSWKLEVKRDVPPSLAARFRHSGLDHFLGW
jgi:stage II sporulation protein AA (anti-sigma F factor antagonist)